MAATYELPTAAQRQARRAGHMPLFGPLYAPRDGRRGNSTPRWLERGVTGNGRQAAGK
jgi:hypothetical protein